MTGRIFSTFSILTFTSIVLLSGCKSDRITPDAYGNFEATEISVSAEQSGQIIRFDAEEGTQIRQGQVLGYIDTAALHLEKRQLYTKAEMIRAKSPGIASQIEVLYEQREAVDRDITRFAKLAESGAAPQKTVDDLRDQKSVLDKRIDEVRSHNLPVARELDVNQRQIALVNNKMENAVIVAPTTGTVLLRIADAGEWAMPGTPLFQMADLSVLTLRAFVEAPELTKIAIGDSVTVRIDDDKDGYRYMKGAIARIANKAEFTPKTIQTKKERTDLVYAVQIRVANPEGILKIGMPGEAIFDQSGTDASNPDKN